MPCLRMDSEKRSGPIRSIAFQKGPAGDESEHVGDAAWALSVLARVRGDLRGVLGECHDRRLEFGALGRGNDFLHKRVNTQR
jgi:hypothetical protein